MHGIYLVDQRAGCLPNYVGLVVRDLVTVGQLGFLLMEKLVLYVTLCQFIYGAVNSTTLKPTTSSVV